MLRCKTCKNGQYYYYIVFALFVFFLFCNLVGHRPKKSEQFMTDMKTNTILCKFKEFLTGSGKYVINDMYRLLTSSARTRLPQMLRNLVI